MPTAGFEYRRQRLHAEEVPLDAIAAQHGTPCYIYSENAIVSNYRAYKQALRDVPHEIHYAVKANSSLGVLAILVREGAGFDIVSGGELFRVLEAGGDPAKVVFSGVGKTLEEVEYALRSGIGYFNCESPAELRVLSGAASRLGRQPRVALRVNPDIDAVTHPYIATGLEGHKFGIAITQAEAVYLDARGLPHLRLEGVSCHIGSQIFDTGVFFEALQKVLELVERLCRQGLPIRDLDLGGGLAVAYRAEDTSPSVEQYAGGLARAIQGKGLRLLLEPGRSIVGQAGILLTKVLYRKRSGQKEFIIVDAAMNDLIRPSLYQSHHEILPVEQRPGEKTTVDVVGPVCESGDFLARDRQMHPVEPGDLLAVCTAGAYGFVLASNYNSRPRPPEIMVEGSRFRLIRERETYPDLIRGEKLQENPGKPASEQP